MCGVCGGRNSSCVHYKDVFQGQPTVGGDSRSAYHEVVVIPSSARNLIIRQPLGKNILALQDRSKGIIFNSEQTSNKYGGHFEIAGSAVEFLKVENLVEELLAKGPLAQELYVLVLLRSRNPGIYYEYWLPKQSHSSGRGHFSVQPHVTQVLPTPTPRTSKSYTVPFYRRPMPSSNQSPRPPSKPLFAYGYGEKPYKGQRSPIFRHVATTSFPKKKGHIEPYETQSESPASYNSDTRHRGPPFKRGIGPMLKPNPSLDYYKTFRNASILKSPDLGNAPKGQDYEIPDLTQGDSGSPEGSDKHQNSFHKTDESEKKQVSISKNPKPLASNIYINKRVDNSLKNYIPNGRLKYYFDEKNNSGVHLNSSGRYAPAALTINVLPLPESMTSKQPQDKHGKDRDEKPRLTRGGICEPCQRIRNQLKHFCVSDFVIRALVVGFEIVQGETRYELEVKQSFKNNLSLQSKEYVWTPDTCRCPKLRSSKEYVIMGRSDSSYSKRESRLLVDKTSFVRTFNPKYARRLQKLKKEHAKKCRKVS